MLLSTCGLPTRHLKRNGDGGPGGDPAAAERQLPARLLAPDDHAAQDGDDDSRKPDEAERRLYIRPVNSGST